LKAYRKIYRYCIKDQYQTDSELDTER